MGIEKAVGDDSIVLGNKEILDETVTEVEEPINVEEKKDEGKDNKEKEKANEVKTEELEKEDDVIGTISITVFRGKRCDIKLEGDRLTGQYIMRAKNNLTKSYLQWIKQRRKN